MKVRTGFVSNSSSTSFCIVGLYLEQKEVKELFGVNEVFDIKIKETLLNIQSQDGDYGGYIGVPIDKMRDYQTLIDFKKFCLEELNKVVVGEEKINLSDVKIHYDGWYDG